jgi:hypothetical protein
MLFSGRIRYDTGAAEFLIQPNHPYSSGSPCSVISANSLAVMRCAMLAVPQKGRVPIGTNQIVRRT